jgi:hypothetical protein
MEEEPKGEEKHSLRRNFSQEKEENLAQAK